MDTDLLNDALVRSGRGDRAAFATVYDLAAPLVLGVAVRVLRNRAMAEEVAQEVMIEAWRTAPRFDPDRGSARAWLTTLAHRRAVDAVRRSESAKARERRVAEHLPPVEDVADSVTRDSDRTRVRAAFSQLSRPQLETVMLAYYGGLTYREVAETTGTPLGTVKTRMKAALARLSDILGGDDD